MFLPLVLFLSAVVTDPLEIRVVGIGDAAHPCTAAWNGEPIALETLPTKVEQWTNKQGEVQVRAAADTSYYCVGRVIYLLQASGFPKIGFISEPRLVPPSK